MELSEQRLANGLFLDFYGNFLHLHWNFSGAKSVLFLHLC